MSTQKILVLEGLFQLAILGGFWLALWYDAKTRQNARRKPKKLEDAQTANAVLRAMDQGHPLQAEIRQLIENGLCRSIREVRK